MGLIAQAPLRSHVRPTGRSPITALRSSGRQVRSWTRSRADQRIRPDERNAATNHEQPQPTNHIIPADRARALRSPEGHYASCTAAGGWVVSSSAAPTRYASSGDLSIAYRVYGDGPGDLVFVPGFVSHLDVGLELANIAGVVARLSSFARGITFDKRGTGLSDRTSGLPTLAERMDDIRAVMDAAGSERAAVVGMSEGGAAAALFAATYPERVSALVLWVTCLGPPLEQRPEIAKATFAVFESYIAQNWGDGTATRFLIGTGAPHERAVDELFARYERNAATPAAAQAVLRRSVAADCRPIMEAIAVPTLVVAHLDDPIIPIELARQTASGIRGARMVETDSPGHWSWDIAERVDLDVIEEFLTGSLADRPADRVLATVLFTDIVGSTERVSSVGDREWR
ncbi:MAG TPA: alpha/beta hydrolase, partial [Acidimicrobiia bacterium]|nr:alpha/beta hydrolase [Acidimicrobiia bacterium]